MDQVRDMECYHSGVALTGARRCEPDLGCYHSGVAPTGARRCEPGLECYHKGVVLTGARGCEPDLECYHSGVVLTETTKGANRIWSVTTAGQCPLVPEGANRFQYYVSISTDVVGECNIQ